MTYDADILLRAAEAETFVATLIGSMLDETPGTIGPRTDRLLRSVIADLEAPLPESPAAAVAELQYRAERPVIIVGIMASVAAQILKGAREAGMVVHLERLTETPYDALLDLDGPD